MNYIPTNTAELYDRLKLHGGLCGELSLKESQIFWQLTPGCLLTAFLEGERAYVELHFGPGRARRYAWRPDPEDILAVLAALGRSGNALVLRSNLFTGKDELLYSGPKENCPYPLRRKWQWGRLYGFELK